MTFKPLSEETREKIRAMGARGIYQRAIAERLGVSLASVGRVLNPQSNQASRERERIKKRKTHQHEPPGAVPVPERVLADRDRRMSLQYRDLTAALMGDPIEPRV